MCSGSEVGSYLKRIDFVYHSTLGLKVIRKKKKSGVGCGVQGLGCRVQGFNLEHFGKAEGPLLFPSSKTPASATARAKKGVGFRVFFSSLILPSLESSDTQADQP